MAELVAPSAGDSAAMSLDAAVAALLSAPPAAEPVSALMEVLELLATDDGEVVTGAELVDADVVADDAAVAPLLLEQPAKTSVSAVITAITEGTG